MQKPLLLRGEQLFKPGHICGSWTEEMTTLRDPILTDRLTLRMSRGDDAAWIAKEIAQEDVHKWLTAPSRPYTLADATDYLASIRDDPNHRVIQYLDQPIGMIGYSVHDDGAKVLGYWLAQSMSGQGLMSEAAKAMVHWHWQHDQQPIHSGWIVGNTASAQILTQLGFVTTGRVEQPSMYYGKDVNVERCRLDQPYQVFPSVKTERLILNAVTLEDLPAIQSGLGNPNVARMMSTVTPNWTYDQAREWLLPRLTVSENAMGRAIRLHDGTFLGSVGMGGTPHNLGYLLAEPYWGKGYGSEALRAFLNLVYSHLPRLDVIEADVYDDNIASARLLTKFGFERVGAAACESIGRVENSASSNYRVTRSSVKA